MKGASGYVKRAAFLVCLLFLAFRQFAWADDTSSAPVFGKQHYSLSQTGGEITIEMLATDSAGIEKFRLTCDRFVEALESSTIVTSQMRHLKYRIHYVLQDKPDGARILILGDDPQAVGAIHDCVED